MLVSAPKQTQGMPGPNLSASAPKRRGVITKLPQTIPLWMLDVASHSWGGTPRPEAITGDRTGQVDDEGEQDPA